MEFLAVRIDEVVAHHAHHGAHVHEAGGRVAGGQRNLSRLEVFTVDDLGARPEADVAPVLVGLDIKMQVEVRHVVDLGRAVTERVVVDHGVLDGRLGKGQGLGGKGHHEVVTQGALGFGLDLAVAVGVHAVAAGVDVRRQVVQRLLIHFHADFKRASVLTHLQGGDDVPVTQVVALAVKAVATDFLRAHGRRRLRSVSRVMRLHLVPTAGQHQCADQRRHSHSFMHRSPRTQFPVRQEGAKTPPVRGLAKLQNVSSFLHRVQ